MNLIARLKMLQGNRGQIEFAAELGIAQSTLSMIYAGNTSIGGDVARKIVSSHPELVFDVAAFILMPQEVMA